MVEPRFAKHVVNEPSACQYVERDGSQLPQLSLPLLRDFLLDGIVSVNKGHHQGSNDE